MSDGMTAEKPIIEGAWTAYRHAYKARISGERYADGGGRAIEVETWEPDGHFWEPWCTATVNLPGNEPPVGCVWIKEYDDNGTTKDNLVKLGIISDLKVRTTHSGYVDIHAYPLTEKGLSLWANEKWFSADGELIRPLPDDCIAACAASGADNGPACREWAEKLGFKDGLDQDHARGHILESGAHTLLEVVEMTDDAVAEWILWNLCWSARDAQATGGDYAHGMVDSRRLSQFLKERVCKAWGYENGFSQPGSRAFAEAKQVHDKLAELHPEEHREQATDTVRGDHHRWCKCGFDYKWDSSD